MLLRSLILQHGPRFTTVALPALHQNSLSRFFEDNGVALMVRKRSPGSTYCSLKVCCSSKVARRLYSDWSESVLKESAPEDHQLVARETEPCPVHRYYYVSAANEAQGPIDGIHIGELIREKIITSDTLIVAEGESHWIPLGRHPEWADEGSFPTLPSPDRGLSASDAAKVEEAEGDSISFNKVMHNFVRTSTLANPSLGSGLRVKK
jgi:hypothetical protein